jgi:DNA-binding NarL/FixJ family response regulator
MATTILLGEDHRIVRQGLRLLLSAEPAFEVIGEASDGLEVIALAEHLQPTVVLLDLVLPSLSGLEVTRRLSRSLPQTRILVLSMHANEAYVLQALRNGAAGYVLKDSPKEVLVQAVHEVASGRHFLGPTVSEHAIAAYIQKAVESPLDPFEGLSTREREILQLAAEGRTAAEIAARLHISPRTAEAHRASAMRKLDLKTQTDLIRYALRKGLLPMDQ